MKGEHKPSKESYFNRYLVRAIKRVTKVIFWLFILFLVTMAIVWAAPQVWNWALG